MKTIFPATLLCDFYKISHREQYPENTQYIFSTWTPRASLLKRTDRVIAFGFQGFIKKYLIKYFNEHFFSRPKEDVVNEYKTYLKYTLGTDADATHIEELHDLGYLPICIKAVEEGTSMPIRVPILTITNTLPQFYWITNYLETLMSCCLWQPTTSATIGFLYRQLLEKYAKETNADALGFVDFQGHDFSMRGMAGIESAVSSGAGHLLSFTGSDTIPAISYLIEYYKAELTKELIASSIPATEHSVMCAYGKDNEFEAYRRFIQDVYPNGFVSIVSDTYDLWYVLNTIIAGLKEEILARDGKIVIRPDSGDPVKIVCGDPESENPFARKGVVEVLWDIFGGTISKEGYKVLDSHIGCIYGDAITLDRCEQICEKLKAKGFASTNMVYGIGSFTYQYNTRDTFGMALKSTHIIVDGEAKNIFKDPITDTNKIKKSQKGLVDVVKRANGSIEYIDAEKIENGEGMAEGDFSILQTIFYNGSLFNEQSLSNIRAKVKESL